MGIGVPRGYIKVVANGTRIYVQGSLYSHYGIIDIYINSEFSQLCDMYTER